jgi:integrating conjugative element protein (TIGR03749 family)
MKKYLGHIGLSLLLMMGHLFAQTMDHDAHALGSDVSYQHTLWNGIPINFSIPVGQERILKFDEPVTFNNTNPQLTADKVSILNNDGFLYIKAMKSFDPIRVEVVIQSTGKVVLVDLSATENSSDTPMNIVLQEPDVTDSAQRNNQDGSQSITDITLMRYAIQHLYAPERLIVENSDIVRSPMFTSHNINLFNNNPVVAMPLESWRGGDLYVTAILLKNNLNSTQVLDPRQINGQWIAASFYPSNVLYPSGAAKDRSTVFLISDKPFNNALNQVRGTIE